jgi:hypothetical protein
MELVDFRAIGETDGDDVAIGAPNHEQLRHAVGQRAATGRGVTNLKQQEQQQQQQQTTTNNNNNNYNNKQQQQQ